MENRETGENFDIMQRPPMVNGIAMDPMAAASLMIQDDLAIMFEGADGQYYLKAGAILLPGFWKLEEKFGMCLSDIVSLN